MTGGGDPKPVLRRVQLTGLAVGVIAGILSVIEAWVAPDIFFPGYLAGFWYWLGIALGCWTIAMLHRLTGGAWGFVIRRVLESGMSTVPLLVLFFLPIIIGMPYLYPWTNPSIVENDPVLRGKAPYLNTESFLIRAAVYFLFWLILTTLMNRWAAADDREEPVEAKERLVNISGFGMLIWGVSITFASIDWTMSIEPHWYSTMYGVLFIGGQAVSGMSFAIVVALLLREYEPWVELIRADHLHDLGNLLFAFVIFWIYVAFMQFLIIWSGDIAEEVEWYVKRIRHNWEWVALALVILHFFTPFFALLSRWVKRHPKPLLATAGLLLVMRLFDLWWMVEPSFWKSPASACWLGLIGPIAMGGFWVAWFAWSLSHRSQLPIHRANLPGGSHG
jgi:hypothetical protein